MKKSANARSRKIPVPIIFCAGIFAPMIPVLFLLSLRSSVFGNYRIPTASMVPTLQVGDHIFANKLAYSLKIPFTKTHILRWSIPQRGDIVSFKYPRDEELDYTKRVIAIPGDKIAMENKRIILNGKRLPLKTIGENDDYTLLEEDLDGRKYIIRHSLYSMPIDDFPEVTVPENMYVVLGDNRDNSSDSRVWGFVPLENIDGRLGFRWIHIAVDGSGNSLFPLITKISFETAGSL